MRFETPFERYQRLPPRKKLIRSMLGATILIPIGVIVLTVVGVHIGITIVLAMMWLTVALTQIASAHRDWKSQDSEPAVYVHGGRYQTPRLLLFIEILGLATVAIALYELAIEHEMNWTLFIVGGLMVLPAMIHIAFWAARQTGRRVD